MNEFKIDGIKIGLISDIKSAEAVVKLFRKNYIETPIVVDPILKSTTNSLLVSKTFDNKTYYGFASFMKFVS